MDLYGLVGHPLGHSFSGKYFAEKFAREGIDARYDMFDIADINDVLRIINEHWELRGLNVTIPHKQAIIPLLDELDPVAAEVGAVNVVKIVREGSVVRLVGSNSDIYGFEKSIAPLLRSQHRRALVLGTGGASKAVVVMLRKMGIEPTYVSRHRGDGILGYDDLDERTMEEHKVIVNCTPLGMLPKTDACAAIPYEYVGAGHLAYDLVYNPEETLFLRKCREGGAATKNGLEMLHLQAERAWQIWQQ